MERFVAGAAALKLGDPLDQATDLGPMVDAQRGRPDPALGRRGRRDGGRGPRSAARADGTFFAPTVLADVPLRRQGLLARRPSRRSSSLSRSPTSTRPSPQVNDSALRAAGRRLHQRPRRRLAGLRRARGRRRDRQRRPDLPDRPHALRRRQGLGPRPRGPALGDRGHDRDPDHGPGPAGLIDDAGLIGVPRPATRGRTRRSMAPS